MTTLIVNGVQFFSAKDEDIFFSWFGGLNGFKHVEGHGRDIIFELDDSKIDDEDRRNLIAIYWRYELDMRPLSQFLDGENTKWFASPERDWHDRIFAKAGNVL